MRRQCKLLGRSRSWYYYRPLRDPDRLEREGHDMRIIEELSEELPFYGYRKIALEAQERYGSQLSFKRTQRLRRQLGLHAVCLPPPTSTPRTAHAVYPYLLEGREIRKANELWETDITYVRLPTGTVYLCAIIDVYSRKVLSWQLSNTMDVLLVLTALTSAMERYGTPEMINTDQGSQFTTRDWIAMVEDLGVRISMDGKGRAFDNIFIERWWRSFKHEDLYLNQYESAVALRRGIERYVEFYNSRRFHQSLDYRRPDEVYAEAMESQESVA